MTLDELDDPRHMIWITKDGDVLNLREMDEDHLRNATNMVGRQLVNLHKELSASFSCMAMFQGDMATYYAEQAADGLSEDVHEVTIKHAVMLKVCEERNIKF